MTLIDFTLANARRYYSSIGKPLAVKGLKYIFAITGRLNSMLTKEKKKRASLQSISVVPNTRFLKISFIVILLFIVIDFRN